MTERLLRLPQETLKARGLTKRLLRGHSETMQARVLTKRLLMFYSETMNARGLNTLNGSLRDSEDQRLDEETLKV